MARIVILNGAPDGKPLVRPIVVAIAGTLVAWGTLSEGNRQPRVAMAAAAAVALAAIIIWVRVLANRRAAAEHIDFLQRAEQAQAIAEATSPLPTASVSINLQKDERCHWVGAARWFELRRRTRRVAYSGLSVSIPITRYVRYRVGTIAPTIESSEELTEIDSGLLYVTNKRVFFDGASKNTTLKFGTLMAVQLFNGGLNLEKQAGRTPTLFLPEGAEAAAACIARGMTHS